MAVVAVLVIHMDRNIVVSMNPSINLSHKEPIAVHLSFSLFFDLFCDSYIVIIGFPALHNDESSLERD